MVTCTITPCRAAVRLNSGVRRRQTKIFSTWGSPAKRHRNPQYPSATYSVQLESSCTPSVGKLSREKPAGAQNQFCAAGSGCPSIQGLLRSARNSSLVSRLTIRPSRHRFAASCWVLAIKPTRRRKAVRLNSGVRPQKKDIMGKSF
jgi:hypothetical protein